jgi:hypothetical protein
MTNTSNTATYPGHIGHFSERITLDTIITSNEVQNLLGKGETLRQTFKRLHAEIGSLHHQMNDYNDRLNSARRTLAYGENLMVGEVYALYVAVVLDQADWEYSEIAFACSGGYANGNGYDFDAERKASDKASRARLAATKAAYGATYSTFTKTTRNNHA